MSEKKYNESIVFKCDMSNDIIEIELLESCFLEKLEVEIENENNLLEFDFIQNINNLDISFEEKEFDDFKNEEFIRFKPLSAIFILLLTISIGYAALSASFHFSGNASVKGNAFGVHFDNIVVNEKSVALSEGNKAATIEENDNTRVDFAVTLNKPGDFYEFTVDVVNAGSIDTMLDKLIKTELDDMQESVLNYTIVYADNAPINKFDGLKASQTRTLKVRLEYDTEVTPEQIQNVSINDLELSVSTNYIQADSNAVFPPDGTEEATVENTVLESE